MKCKTCQKEFLKNPHRGKIYCSLKCYWKKSPRFKFPCKNCGKRFWTYPSFQKVGEGFLCGKECRISWVFRNYNSCKTDEEKRVARNARKKLIRAVYAGKVIKSACIICGNKKSNGHHEDYSKPLEVIWLCHKHHQLKHFGKL